VTGRLAHVCWCGGEPAKEIGRYYRRCNDCGAAVLAVLPGPEHFDVVDDERDFYGRQYWAEYARSHDLPDIGQRVRSYLSERCVFWLERLLEVTRPPGRFLEVGCGPGVFVRLLQELGFVAIGTELSGWIVEFAKRTFDVTVLRGRVETLDLDPGFKCIAAFDVLEHVDDPLKTVRRCSDLLAPNGVLLLQTPWYRGEGPDWKMFQADEHVHLFTEESIRLLLARAGFEGTLVRPSLFPYDMWVVATRDQVPSGRISEVAEAGGRQLPAAFQGLLGLSYQIKKIRDELAVAEIDRAARLAQIEALTRQLQEAEAVRLEEIREQERMLRESEADRAARLEQIREQGRLLRESETDRVARLDQINLLSDLWRESEADRVARLDQIHRLSDQLRESEADRVARLDQIHRLSDLLRESEADRVARLDQIHRLSDLLRESEADRVARLEALQNLQTRIAKMERTWIWQLYSALPSSLTGRPSGE